MTGRGVLTSWPVNASNALVICLQQGVKNTICVKAQESNIGSNEQIWDQRTFKVCWVKNSSEYWMIIECDTIKSRL